MIKECMHCSITFNARKSIQKYCSKICSYESSKRGKIKQCKICAKDFYCLKAKESRGWGLYCSRKCRGVDMVGDKNILYSLPKERMPGFGKNMEDNPNWKGGIAEQKGYKKVYIGGQRYEMEHRRIVEQRIGRKLTSEEVVHHIDGNKSNNNTDNLMLCANQSEHMKIHGAKK